MFGNPETTTGGNVFEVLCRVRLDIRRVTSIKDGDEVMETNARESGEKQGGTSFP